MFARLLFTRKKKLKPYYLLWYKSTDEWWNFPHSLENIKIERESNEENLRKTAFSAISILSQSVCWILSKRNVTETNKINITLFSCRIHLPSYKIRTQKLCWRYRIPWSKMNYIWILLSFSSFEQKECVFFLLRGWWMETSQTNNWYEFGGCVAFTQVRVRLIKYPCWWILCYRMFASAC